MPYATNADLPLPVRKIYSEHCQTVFRAAFNAALDEYKDEAKAFPTAHAAAKKCETSKAEKGALAYHKTATDDDAYSGPSEEAKIPNAEGAATFRAFYAWQDPAKDPDTKAAYKGGHHRWVGHVGPASLRACSTIIGELNGGRGGFDIPSADRAGVHAHVAHHLEDAGRTAPPLAKAMLPLKATPIDDDHFRLLAIPFGGPLPLPGAPRGVDLDAEWFSERTDIKADWLPYRLVDWHHGGDDLMGRTVIAKADKLTEEDDGWWVDVWLQHGERRLELVRKLAERGAQIYGSSESIAGLTKKAATGEILVWPYWRQTLTTSPQNTYSIIRPLKAMFEDIATDYIPSPAFWRDLAASLDDLGTDLRMTSGAGEYGAKSGRVLSGANEEALREALDSIGVSLTRINEVLAKVRQLKE